MGEVYRAHDSELGREVALKVLSPAVSGNPDSLSRFEREARLLASLNHPNIAAIYGVTRQDSTRALPVDKRTDIWAFGCVLYETLTGRRAFGGSTATEITTAVLEQEPDWSALPENTPAAVRRLLRRTLEKDQRRRLRDIADARVDLAATDSTNGSAVPRPRRSSWPVHAAWAGAVGAALLIGVVSPRRTTTAPAAAVHLSLAIPPVSAQQVPMMAISSEGRKLAVATAAGLLVRDFGAGRAWASV
jgi:serine/threonine protein kinase